MGRKRLKDQVTLHFPTMQPQLYNNLWATAPWGDSETSVVLQGLLRSPHVAWIREGVLFPYHPEGQDRGLHTILPDWGSVPSPDICQGLLRNRRDIKFQKNLKSYSFFFFILKFMSKFKKEKEREQLIFYLVSQRSVIIEWEKMYPSWIEKGLDLDWS